MRLSDKQKAFWTAPFHRWNIKHGATRSGKTWLDYYLIPRRIRERAGKDGLVVLLGNTKGTLQRNVIEPMQAIYGGLVGDIRNDNTAVMFGERVHCLGADNKKHVDRLRGASIKYCYGDEIVTWNAEVFEMLKSRLDKPWSCFDGTCNPKGPDHWLKRFLDSGADIFQQQYSLDDNPFLDEGVREALKREHAGVFYDRYILGRWTVAEGLVFPRLAAAPEKWLLPAGAGAGPFTRVHIGADFGGNGSQTWFVAVGFLGWSALTAVDEEGLPVRAAIDANDIARAYLAFYRRVMERWGRVDGVFCDSASPTMINTLVSAAREAGLPWRRIAGVVKNPVSQRPLTIDRLLGAERLRISAGCPNVLRALTSLRWDERHPDQPEDRNEGNINDIYDAFCYSWLTHVDFIDRRR